MAIQTLAPHEGIRRSGMVAPASRPVKTPSKHRMRLSLCLKLVCSEQITRQCLSMNRILSEGVSQALRDLALPSSRHGAIPILVHLRRINLLTFQPEMFLRPISDAAAPQYI